MSIICGLCHSNPPKYKCPSCEIPYCSLACYKPHKLIHAANGTAQPIVSQVSHMSTSDEDVPVPPHKFSQLLASPDIVSMLRSPTLQSHIRAIYAQSLKPSEEEFERRAGQHYRGRLGGGGRGRGKERGKERGGRGGGNGLMNWNQEKGDDAALRVLKRLRSGNEEVEGFARRVINVLEGEEH